MKSRIIFGSLYKSEEFAELSTQEKLLTIYLMTNETVGLVPAYKINGREICFWLGLEKNELKSLIKNLEKIGIYEIECYVVIGNPYSNYLYHKGVDNKNKDAMFKEFMLLPSAVQDKLGELGFDLTGEFMVPYGYPDGTSKVLINNKQEINNKKQEILNKKYKGSMEEKIELPDWLEDGKEESI
jgi:hypothetical protein